LLHAMPGWHDDSGRVASITYFQASRHFCSIANSCKNVDFLAEYGSPEFNGSSNAVRGEYELGQQFGMLMSPFMPLWVKTLSIPKAVR
jgi:hypothetical protein